VPTPRHASHAAFDPVETVTPPFIADISLMPKERRWVHTEPIGSCCISHSFYAYLLSGAVVRVIAFKDAVKDGI
jgi:hypothetical protein